MTRLAWEPRYAIGIEAVDHEHRELIAQINSLMDGLSASGNDRDTEALLGELHASISAHFALEERVMIDARYDDYTAHKADHESLLDQIRDMMDVFCLDPLAGRTLLARRLGAWFAGHFATFDARFHKTLGN